MKKKLRANRTGRLDKVLSELMKLSRSKIQEAIEDSRVSVNEKVVTKPAYEVQKDDLLVVREKESESRAVNPELEVIYEDDDLLVINKSAGQVSVPAPGVEGPTLEDEVQTYLNSEEAELAHRLDKDTSGVVLAAKDEETLGFLQDQFRNREVKKTYLALTEGCPDPKTAEVSMPIARDPKNRSRFTVMKEGRKAVTKYDVLTCREGHGLVRVHPVTGRTHQIRVHMKAIGFSVAGDEVYGGGESFPRQMLHAWRIKFILPDGNTKQFVAPIPEDMMQALSNLDLEDYASQL